MNHERFNAYRIMWIFVFFDLPTETAEERREASLFRKRLLKNGFGMFQYSIYTRHCPSAEHAEKHVAQVRKILPDKGSVVITQFTDRQFGAMVVHSGRQRIAPPEQNKYQQLQFF